MQRNPPSPGFVFISDGSFTSAYRNDDIVECIIKGYIDKDPYGNIDCSKDILIKARKLCDENSKRFLPEIKRKIIYNDRDCYEFVYEMPFYELENRTDEPLVKTFMFHIAMYNANLSPKITTAEKIVLELANNVWKNCNSIEVSGACGAVLAIEKACKNITTEPLFWDLKPFNMAMHGNQMIFLDPCFCMISTKDLLKIWKKNGIVP